MALCPHSLKCMPSKEAVTGLSMCFHPNSDRPNGEIVLTTDGRLSIMAQARRELDQTNPMNQ
jgi:hypothetical protein